MYWNVHTIFFVLSYDSIFAKMIVINSVCRSPRDLLRGKFALPLFCLHII